ncbi:hypothetical protein [Paenibacillus antarcticus]|uniref:Uncharacterized protein n=1 Tax=Paenibacillus antarcticus TaxID=253703 RepID=A0A168KJD4_9BACL|nr:hypothetical protein [Paenibacillus antarcticus]OAB42099.1 hypothetical protein PBAT_20470 [Paenibacillus antarcticus]
MKSKLIIIQGFYLLTLLPWFLIWGLSFMVFDNGISVWGISIMTIVSLYPIAVVICSILSWLLKEKVKPLNTFLISAIPLLWVISLVAVIIGY